MINTIIFDLDGTLIDSLVDLANTVNVILTEKGYPTHTLMNIVILLEMVY